MNACGFYINNVSYKKITESFTLLAKKPAEEEALPPELGRMAFDKRL
jgi:hypothetical protein